MTMPWNSYCSFAHKVKQVNRYFHDKDTQNFFDVLLETAEERVKIIPKNQRFFRAQLGSDKNPSFDAADHVIDYNAIPFTKERMKPDPYKTLDGRINPRGMAFLYLATNETTAISEVRPWIGTDVTVAQFETVKDIKVVDCSNGEINPLYITVCDMDKLYTLKEPTPQEAIEIVWRWIDMAFSEPVDRNDSIVDYVPTQIIAELLKTNGYGGIKYRSLFNNGKNLALFDINSARQFDDGKVIQVTKVLVDYKQVFPTQFQRRNTNE